MKGAPKGRTSGGALGGSNTDPHKVFGRLGISRLFFTPFTHLFSAIHTGHFTPFINDRLGAHLVTDSWGCLRNLLPIQ